jgi:hypothetical protein
LVTDRRLLAWSEVGVSDGWGSGVAGEGVEAVSGRREEFRNMPRELLEHEADRVADMLQTERRMTGELLRRLELAERPLMRLTTDQDRHAEFMVAAFRVLRTGPFPNGVEFTAREAAKAANIMLDEHLHKFSKVEVKP